MNITNKNITTLVDVARDLMCGEQPPPAGPRLEKIECAIRELHTHKSPVEFELLGYALLGVLIERIGSNVQAQATLERFIRGAADC